ncbi:asparagine synthase (glutamine-hydrolyzing) [Caballeronia sp. BR00000012568055]|uniref:asparagine synthase (glutamine-hydrolyzing) n=1 Tax=Caballeronia sp. BR00000012568055 TaxID=2918761 RepID=UPI0023F77E50|nr:asparagine synthase (glutamine-hydrolyzing) [Caballeronia sp. BR00000012568055]
MCGIVGFVGGCWNADFHADLIIERMADAIAHRGPDDNGAWIDQQSQVALGHRRLSVQDISAAGHQPMPSASGRYVIVFNGEIYNHLGLRKSLQDAGAAPDWRSTSDTETLLAGFDAWGIQPTVERSIGMFAFAVWDKQTRTLTLARDRLGEKPLYYGWHGKGRDRVFLFGSELNALRVHPGFEDEIDRGAVTLQLRYGCVPAPYSIYKDLFKLEPGCMLSVSAERRESKSWTYWSAVDAAQNGMARPFSGTAEEAVNELEILLKRSVRQQMISDMPIGAFLSGGIDSSTVVALMQAESSKPIKTFTIGFHEESFDEAKYAKEIARHLGTDHTEMYVSADQSIDVLQRLPELYSEPFSDASQIPTFLVSQLAREHVTVSLSGDAGDELFCGYTRYQQAPGMWNGMSRMPAPLRNLTAKAITGISPESWNGLANVARRVRPGLVAGGNVGHRLHKGAGMMKCRTFDEFYLGVMSQWEEPVPAVIGGYEPATLLSGNAPELAGMDATHRMMVLDLLTYLPDDILTKVDRAAMGVSLETRVPFLDHRVVEFAWRLPQSMKVRDAQTKWALRQVLYRRVPRELIERPKMGFGVPIGEWLRGRLRGWAEALLDEKRIAREGFFEPSVIRRKWAEHLSGARNWQRELWSVLMFQLWLEGRGVVQKYQPSLMLGAA